MTSPRASTVMVSDRFSTTLRLCSTISTVRSAAACLMRAAMRPTSSWPMPAVGSSSSIISGSRASVVAISSARLRTWGSSTATVPAKSARPTAASSSRARAFSRSRVRSERQKSNECPRWRWSASRTFSSTLRCGNTAEIWNERTSPSRAMSAGFDPVMSRPLKRIRPLVGVRKWVRRLKQVVLPAPLGPINAWIAPRRTRRFTFLTATNPRNSLVSPSVSRMASVIARRSSLARMEHGLALLLPRAVGLVDLPRRHAVVLRAHHLLDHGARVAVERGVEQPLGVRGGRRRRLADLVDDVVQCRVHRPGRADPVDEPDGARLVGRDLVVEERQLLGPAQADDAGQAEDRPVGNDAVASGAEPDHRVAGGQAQVAGDRELKAAADRLAVEHAERDLGHVLELVERPDPVPVERLADRARGQRGAMHPRAERAPGATHGDERDLGIGGGPMAVLGP